MFLPALFMHSLSTVLQNCHFWNAKLPLLETAPNCHSRLVYTPLLFVYLGQVFQFEYIDEWETSVSVSPSLLPTSSKYVCMISGLSIVILTRNGYFCRVIMGRYIAFAEQLFSQFPQIHYTGIDVSAAMKIMAEKLLGDATGGHMRMSFVESFDKLDDSYWASASEVPNLVVFNMSYFFSNVDSSFTENLANRMIAVMKRHPLNRYVFVIQHSEHDARLRSFTVFKRLLSQHVAHIKSARTTFRYESGGVSKTIPLCYEIWKAACLPCSVPN